MKARPAAPPPQDLAAAAEAWLAAGEASRAADAFARLALAAPRNPRWRIGRARAALLRKEPAEAIRHLTEAESMVANPPHGWILLRGRALAMGGDEAAAEASFRAVLAAEPQHTGAALALAQLLGPRDRKEEALALLERAPPGFATMRARIPLLIEMQRRQEAVAAWKTCLDQAETPDQLGALLTIAAVLHGRGEAHAGACRAIRRRLAAHPVVQPQSGQRALLAARLALALGETAIFRQRAEAALRAGSLDPQLEAALRATLMPEGGRRADKVFVIGLSKTGTTSLHAALERLGYLSQHWSNPLTGQMLDMADGEVFDALSDTPVADMVERLLDDFPQARFILSTRAVASWCDSMLRHLRRQHSAIGLEGLRDLVSRPADCPHGEAWCVLHRHLYTDHPDLPAAHAAHTERVHRLFRHQPNRLLEFDVVAGDGWPKLCSFLGLPVPSGPFPRENARPAAGGLADAASP